MDPSVLKDEGDDKVTEELKSLNQSFLSSVQDALTSSPDACLAPLALDYLKFAYPLLKKGNDGGGDYVEGARFFANLKRNMSERSASASPVPNKRSANGDVKVEEIKANFPFQAPAASSDDNKKTPPGPGFFGLGSSKSPMGSTSTGMSISKASVSSSGPSATVTTASTTGFSFGEPKTVTTNSTGSLGGSLFGQSKTTDTATSSTFSPNFFKSSSTSGSLTLPPPLFGTTTSSSTNQKPGTSLFGSFQPSSSSSGFGFSSAPSTGMFSGFGSGPSGAKQPESGPVNSSENNDDDEEEGEPEPPPKPVVEDDALYTQRIKLFEMVGKSFKDLGVSNLFVKPLPSGKHQLLVRADNSLGTILVNLILNASVPVKQNKPTNILLTVPPSENKQTTIYLLRVKDPSQGNELIKEIEKYKAL